MKLSIFGAILLAINGGQMVFAAPTTTEQQEGTNATTTEQIANNATSTTSGYIPQKSPIFPEMKAPTDVVTSYNYGPYNTSDTLPTYKLEGYPEPFTIPDVNHPEVKAAVAQIDWSLVPKAPVRKQDKKGDFKPDTDGDEDPYCWWTDTNCVKPKINIPEDLHSCPTKGDWGLTYDDGPFNVRESSDKDAAKENPFAEPALYNFLAKTNNQKADLFYVGSNVVTYPAAAKRAFNDGHFICVHTYSHPAVTTLKNEQVVAELYWTLKAIKEVTGVTPKCWRPPQGDVDDRLRSIAWQMGLRTILWDWDTNDWDMPAPGGGNLSPSTVDGYFKEWIETEKSGKETTGHIVLEHELNSATIGMTEKWLPIIQKEFNVLPASACNGITHPYWEENMVYPLENVPVGGASNSSLTEPTTGNTTTVGTTPSNGAPTTTPSDLGSSSEGVESSPTNVNTSENAESDNSKETMIESVPDATITTNDFASTTDISLESTATDINLIN